MSDLDLRRLMRDYAQAEAPERRLVALARAGVELVDLQPRSQSAGAVACQVARLRQLMHDDPVAHWAGRVRCRLMPEWLEPGMIFDMNGRQRGPGGLTYLSAGFWIDPAREADAIRRRIEAGLARPRDFRHVVKLDPA